MDNANLDLPDKLIRGRTFSCMNKGNEQSEKIKWSKWYLIPEKTDDDTQYIIRRYRVLDGCIKWQRYPRKEIKGLSATEIKAFVTRLNGEREEALKRAKAAYDIKHIFITPEILSEWERSISDSQTDQGRANSIIMIVQRYFLHFWIHKMNLSDPMFWYEQQNLWGYALLNVRPKELSKNEWENIRIFEEGFSLSAKTIRDYIMFANRFIAFIHNKSPRLFPLLKFAPISKAVLKKHDADRSLDKDQRGIGKYVHQKDWLLICDGDVNRGIKPISADLLPFVKLGYYLGLRSSETLGVKLDDIKDGYFHLRRQLESIPEGRPKYGPPKNRQGRKIYYWGTTNDNIYRIIKDIPRLMHPDTLVHKLAAEMRRLKLDYSMHDFRRTWITNALQAGQPLVRVRDAAGHEEISTTNRYIMNIDEFGDKTYKPPN